MDRELVIERHREALLRIVGSLFALIGFAEDGGVGKLARPLYLTILRVLRPAEWAVRRLIVAAAHGLAVKPRALRPMPAGLVLAGRGRGRLPFPLFDPRGRSGEGVHKRFRSPGVEPRIRFFGAEFDPRVPLFRPVPAAAPATRPEEETVNAARLSLRLAAIRSALEDLPRQARRYARWQARPAEARRPRLATLLRRGAPPRFRGEPDHEVHAILAECHWLARSLPALDSS